MVAPTHTYSLPPLPREFSQDQLDKIRMGYPDISGPMQIQHGPVVNGPVRIKPPQKAMLLSADPIARKNMPITTGVLDYFPRAMAEVAKVSKAGNNQHNPGQPLHWDKTKSLDHADCIARHLIDRGSFDTDGQRHSAKLVWRALANLETELELEARANT